MSHRMNYSAVVVAAVAHFILGAVWFAVFFNAWLAGVGETYAQLARYPTLTYVIAFASDLVLAWILAWLVLRTEQTTIPGGVMLGAVLWFGFVGTTLATETAFEARSFKIFAITAGYPLLGMLIMGGIVGGWTKKRRVKEYLGLKEPSAQPSRRV